MTLLDEFDRMVFRPGIPVGTYERIRRAIAIAQAVDEMRDQPCSPAEIERSHKIIRRADELLKDKP